MRGRKAAGGVMGVRASSEAVTVTLTTDGGDLNQGGGRIGVS